MQTVKQLVGRLNTTCRSTLQEAAALCLSRTHYDVEVEHWLLKLLERSNTDLHRILKAFRCDDSRVKADLMKAIDGFKTGNGRSPAFAPDITQLLSDAWMRASVDFEAERIRSGHLLLSLLNDPKLARIREACDEFELISDKRLKGDFRKITSGSAEDREAPPEKSRPEESVEGKALGKFTIDLTQRARQGEIDPVKEREAEIRQVIDILMRRRQNNPILTGEAGVGKTAVVEGLALRIAERDVPPPLLKVCLRTLDLGLLQAGAGVRGEFENRLKSVIQEVKASPQPIILFIDEAHTLIGAGGQAGQGDAANMLKPALARGELRTIAATTWAEYKKYFEKDAALARRFQAVKVEEPSPEQAIVMMRHLAPKLEEHHGVRILEEAIDAAVRLSDRYISGRQLPDKAVTLLDTACARLALGQSAIPESVEDCQRRLANLNLEIEILNRENLALPLHEERLKEVIGVRDRTERELTGLEERWEKERDLIERIRETRHKIESIGAKKDEDAGETIPADRLEAPKKAKAGSKKERKSDEEDLKTLRSRLEERTASLRALQGETPLMQVMVEAQTIAEIVSGWTGIPVGKMMRDEIQTVLHLADRLEERVKGQSHALATIAKRIQTSRAGLEDPRKPIGVFLLVGPSGVGKTETALALADTLYGGEQNMVTINMSEYQEAHTVSSLKGSPPGYVGYGEGGVLTEAVRRKPYCVVLLDEVEKAHPDVLELFFQVFDKGVLEDGEGRQIDFRNTVIILTSNVGTDTIMKLCADDETRPDADGLAEALKPELLKKFPAAFLGRLVSVVYYPISDRIMRMIVQLKLERVAARIRLNHKAQLSWDKALEDTILERCTDVDSGARNVDHILTQTLLPEVSREVLGRMAEEASIRTIRVGVSKKTGAFSYRIK